MNDTTCIVCRGEITAMPDVDDPRFTTSDDAPWVFDTTATGHPFHVKCENVRQLSLLVVA